MNRSHVALEKAATVPGRPVLFFAIAALAAACLLFATPASALKTDRDQPADIQADDIEFDFKKGTRTYINNVLAVQGTMRLKADKLIAIYANNDLQKATMWGSLARFKQRPDGKDYDVQGWAKKMIVDQQANTITLIGQAALQQGPDTARGETIIYNMANDTLNVKGGAKIGSGGATGQARPNKKLKDPFANDDLPEPPPPSNTTIKANEDQPSNDDDANTPYVAPTSSGRSRLILRPKKKKPAKETTDEDDKDGDDDEDDDKNDDDETESSAESDN